jgi:hypothetical protein
MEGGKKEVRKDGGREGRGREKERRREGRGREERKTLSYGVRVMWKTQKNI